MEVIKTYHLLPSFPSWFRCPFLGFQTTSYSHLFRYPHLLQSFLVSALIPGITPFPTSGSHSTSYIAVNVKQSKNFSKFTVLSMLSSNSEYQGGFFVMFQLCGRCILSAGAFFFKKKKSMLIILFGRNYTFLTTHWHNNAVQFQAEMHEHSFSWIE